MICVAYTVVLLLSFGSVVYSNGNYTEAPSTDGFKPWRQYGNDVLTLVMDAWSEIDAKTDYSYMIAPVKVRIVNMTKEGEETNATLDIIMQETVCGKMMADASCPPKEGGAKKLFTVSVSKRPTEMAHVTIDDSKDL